MAASGISLPAAAAGGQAATTLYALQTSLIYANTSGAGPAIGSVTPGTPLQVSGEVKNGLEEFTLDAWSQQGDDTTLFAAQGERIVLVTLADSAPHPKVLSMAKDDYGNVWNKVELSDFVKSDSLTPDQNAVWKQAITLYSTRCSACHALHKPSEFTVNQWPKILQTMTKNAALQPAEAALVTQYIQAHAKQ
mgnify:FL=1